MQFLDLAVGEQAIRILLAYLCRAIYPIIGHLYNLFNNVSKLDILSFENVKNIYQRVTIILTIVMVFYITFQFVKYVVQPEAMSDKEKGAGNMALKIVIVIALIAFVPTIFNIAYDVQDLIISKNIIGKIILGPSGSKGDYDLGSDFAANMFEMFYNVDSENANQICYNSDKKTCGDIVDDNIDSLREGNGLEEITLGLNETYKSDLPLITFHGFFAVIFGLGIAYILILYCIDVGTRWAQLLYLQIIAPIPILGYLSPKKDGMFQNWVKQCTTTYIDLFLRVAIINIVLFLCREILQSETYTAIQPSKYGINLDTLVFLIVIMGVMLFAHKAPKMIQEIFPKMGSAAASGKFGLKATERMAPEAARVAGAALGSTRWLGGAVARGVNTYKRNKAERERTGLNKKQQLQEHQKNRQIALNKQAEYNQALRNRNRFQQQANWKEKRNDGSGLTNEQFYQKQLNEARKAKDQANSQVAEDKNNRYRSVAGQTLKGAAAGALTGAMQGAKATKLEDIGKKVKEGYAEDKKNIASYEKWLDSGGTTTTERIWGKLQKSIGIDPTATYEDNMRVLDNAIQANESLISVEKDTKTKFDSVTSRAESKIDSGELKNEIDSQFISSTPLAKIDTKGAKTLTELKATYDAKASSAKSAADAEAKRVNDLGTSATAADIANRDRLAKEAMLAENEAKTVRKQAVRYAFDQILKSNSPETDGTFDQVMVTNVKDAKEAIAVSRTNVDTKDKVLERIDQLQEKVKKIDQNGNTYEELVPIPDNKKQRLREGYLTGNFASFDDFDQVITIITGIAGDRSRENMGLKEQKRQIKSSSEYIAAKANSEDGKK